LIFNRIKLKKLLCCFLESLPETDFLSSVFSFMFDMKPATTVNSGLRKSTDPNLQIRLLKATRDCETILVSELHTETKIEAFLEVLREKNMKKWHGQVFVALLEQTVANVSSSQISTDKKKSVAVSQLSAVAEKGK